MDMFQQNNSEIQWLEDEMSFWEALVSVAMLVSGSVRINMSIEQLF